MNPQSRIWPERGFGPIAMAESSAVLRPMLVLPPKNLYSGNGNQLKPSTIRED